MSGGGLGNSTEPGGDVTIRGLTWPKLLAIIGAILTAAGALIAVLLVVVWGGVQTRFDRLDKRVDGLESNFKAAVVSGIRVQDLLGKAPALESTINDTHTQVLRLGDALQHLQTNMVEMDQQLASMQKTVSDAEVGVRNLTFEMNQIVPLVPGLTELLIKFAIPAPKEKR